MAVAAARQSAAPTLRGLPFARMALLLHVHYSFYYSNVIYVDIDMDMISMLVVIVMMHDILLYSHDH